MNEVDPNVAGAAISGFLVLLTKLITTYIPSLKTKYIPLLLLFVGTPLQLYGQHGGFSGLNVFDYIGAVMWAASAVGLHQTVRQTQKAVKKPNTPIMHLLVCLMPLGLVGCAVGTTSQHDISYNPDGTLLRDVTTTTKGRAFFNSNAKMTDVLITNSDEEQQTAIGEVSAISEESLAEIVSKAVEGAVEGLKIYSTGGASAALEGLSEAAGGSSITLSSDDLNKILDSIRNKEVQ